MELAIWTDGGLTWKLIDEHDLVGIDSGNVRRYEATVDGGMLIPRAYDALMAAPAEVRDLPRVKASLAIEPYIDTTI